MPAAKLSEAPAVSLSKIAAGRKERKTALEANASAQPAVQCSRSTTSTPQRRELHSSTAGEMRFWREEMNLVCRTRGGRIHRSRLQRLFDLEYSTAVEEKATLDTRRDTSALILAQHVLHPISLGRARSSVHDRRVDRSGGSNVGLGAVVACSDGSSLGGSSSGGGGIARSPSSAPSREGARRHERRTVS